VVISKEIEARIRRHFHADTWPVATIARELGRHHSTVRRVLTRDGVPAEAFVRRAAMIDPYLPFILETLEKYPRIKASRLFAMVRERGYEGAKDHFRAMIARHRPRKPSEAFLRRPALIGEEAQVDWAHFGEVEVDGTRRKLSAFALVLKWSRKMVLRFGFEMTTGAFLSHHQHAFEALGGVPRVILYDNLKSAVIARVGDAIVFNDDLLAFAGHYHYEPKPCAPYRGNEKGAVERAIRDVRESFWEGRAWAGLEQLNADAAAWSKEIRGQRKNPDDPTLTNNEAFEQEKSRLRALPDDRFPVEDRATVRIQKTPYARFDGNDYSVPHTHVRRTVTISASQGLVRVLDGVTEIARHPRCWGKRRTIEDARHIADLVAVKREAHKQRGQTRLIGVVPVAAEFLRAAADRGTNIGALSGHLNALLDDFGHEELAIAMAEALAAGALHAAAVRQVLDRRRKAAGKAPPASLGMPDDPRFRGVVVRHASLDSYDIFGERNPDDTGDTENGT
jgi:transposase